MVEEALFDTNIVIAYLKGSHLATLELGAYRVRYISIITVIEVMVKAEGNEDYFRETLKNFVVLPLTNEIAELAAVIRREPKMKLPDAVIPATARSHGLTLITRNTRDFPAGTTGVIVPYQL